MMDSILLSRASSGIARSFESFSTVLTCTSHSPCLNFESRTLSRRSGFPKKRTWSRYKSLRGDATKPPPGLGEPAIAFGL